MNDDQASRIRDAQRAPISPIRIAVTLLILALVGWIFLELADEVLEAEPLVLDERILRAMRNPSDLKDPLGPPWFEDAMRDVTALGSAVVATLFTLATLGYLLLAGQRRLALFTAIAVFGGMGVLTLAKAFFARERPDVVPGLVPIVDASFPSGHSMIATVMYLTLGVLFSQLSRSRTLGAYLLSVAAGLSVAVGFTRVYFGVHYPSDVVAGWTLGLAWALPWTLVLERMRRTSVRTACCSPAK